MTTAAPGYFPSDSDHLSLLLVEDDAGDAHRIEELLGASRRSRFAVVRAARLDAALEKLQGRRFDAALLALTLPDSSGLATFQRLRAAAPGLPIVIMTGPDGEEAGVEAVLAGAQDYLIKGESASEALARAIRHAIERLATSFRLRESEMNYRRLFDGVADPIVIIDPETRLIVDANDRAAAFYGYSRAELIGASALMLSAQPEQSLAALEELRRADKRLFGYREHRDKSGRIFPVEIHCSTFTIDGRRLAINSVRDITSRIQAETELLRREKELSAEHARLVEAQAVAKVGSCETNLRTMSVLWSAETHRIFETDPETFSPTHEKFLKLVHPDDRARVDAAFVASLRSRQRFSIAHRLKFADGREKVVEERWQAFLGEDGAPARAVGTCQDITDKTETLRLAEESLLRFKRMAESISQVFWMTDLDKKAMVYVSPAYESIWGKSCGSLYENPATWLDAIVPEDRPRVLAALPRQVKGTYDECYRIRRPDGAVRWIRDRAFPIADDAGRVCQLTGVAQDITEQAAAEAALSEARDFLEKAQEVADTGSWIDPLKSDEELIWSKQCRRIFGVGQKSRLLFSDIMALIHPDDLPKLVEVRRNAIRDWKPYTIEYRITRPDGVQREIFTRAEPIRDEADGSTKLIGVVRDVTERNAAERRLKETESMLQQAQKMDSMGRLAGGVAHDFNNILTAILGLSEMAMMNLPQDHPVRADIEEIRQSGLRAANLTQQLLAFSRRQASSPRLIDLDAAVAGMAAMLRRIIGEHVELAIEPGAAGVSIKADPGRIEQLVMNLAVNARDAMPQGGTIAIRTEMTELRGEAAVRLDLSPGGYVGLSVADTGAGMTEEVQRRLFEPFFTTKEKGKGTGLGLSTCYGVVKQSGGAIECRSAPGKGTTFRIYLPFTHAVEPARAPAVPRELLKGGETILVVEDEETVRRLMLRVLRGLGYAALESSDGEEALARMREDSANGIRLLLTDIVMPKLNGWDLARRAEELRPDLPVLFVSGYTDDTFAGMCPLNAKMNILAKPFTAEDLAVRVRAAMDAG